MAMCWIMGIINEHPTHTLRVRCEDHGRNPKIRNRRYGPNETFELPPGQRVEASEVDNFAIPWNNDKGQRVLLQFGPAGGPQETLQVDVTGRQAWDWVRLRNGSGDVLGEFEVGSLGNAPGINHSGWKIYLGADGKLALKNEYRQGASRDDLLGALKVVTSALSPGNVLQAVKQAKDIVVELRAVVGEARGIVDDTILTAPKKMAEVVKDVSSAVSGLTGIPGIAGATPTGAAPATSEEK